MKSVVFLILLAGIASITFAEEFPGHLYKEVTIKQLCDAHRIVEDMPESRQRLLIEPPQRYKSTVTLLRVTRKLRPEMKEHLLRLNKAMPDIFKLEILAYYENEVRFRENEREYIAPLQKVLVPFLFDETKKKKIIEIYYYFVGMIEDDPILLINEFKVE